MKKLHSFDEVFDGQKVFRLVLEAMSNPGRKVSISEKAEKCMATIKLFLLLQLHCLTTK